MSKFFNLKNFLLCIMAVACLCSVATAADAYPAPKKGCLSCHEGIEPIRDHQSEMALQTYAMGESLGDPNGCVVCHGGNPEETKDKALAHKGVPKGSLLEAFTPVPGSLHVADKTCGACHPEQTSSVKKSLMNTDAGKIKVITYGWGLNTDDDKHRYANHHTVDGDGFEPIYGTPEYKEYMKELAKQHENQFPKELAKIPQTNQATLKDNPEEAIYSYLRNCNACHLDGKGKQQRGHYRGMGCSACHAVYGTEGFYEGGDKSIDKNKTGHLLVHAMQGTGKSKVKVNDGEYSGIQVSTCNACHSSGRRISLAYQGLFAVDRGSEYAPFTKDGKLQQPNATYLYKHIKEDVHYKAGMLCQDCHTSPDMHGNGNIGTVALGDVEVKCQDCHGTPQKYPWELNLGYGDELMDSKKVVNKTLKDFLSKPRGLSDKAMSITEAFATSYDKKDGYLLSARGNPFGNVVKDDEKVLLHSASGKTLEVPVLKTIEKNNKWKNPDGRLAMVGASKHMDTMECYACHATWASSYYGYDYSIDYSKGSSMIDWVESAESIRADGTTADHNKSFVMQPGGSAGDYSHARWESPILGINGKGRVTPVVGVIQTVGTVIDQNGSVLMVNNVAKRKDGVLAIDMQPLNPHNNSREARACNECHQNPQTMGFGVPSGGGDASKAVHMGVKDANGNILTKSHKEQIGAIPNLKNGDFMQLLDKDGKQVMSVDPHFDRSSPLLPEQIKSLNDPDYMKKAKDSLLKVDKAKKK